MFRNTRRVIKTAHDLLTSTVSIAFWTDELAQNAGVTDAENEVFTEICRCILQAEDSIRKLKALLPPF